MKDPRSYPLDIENIGGDSYKLMSKGHHDLDAFMVLVTLTYPDWPMGRPSHEWFRCVPAEEGRTMLVPAVPHSRGSFPVTVAIESYGADRWEAPTTTAA